jgi:hypothetical protein
MRAFVKLRRILAMHKGLARKLDALERKLGRHDEKFQMVFEAIRQLMALPPEPPKKRRIAMTDRELREKANTAGRVNDLDSLHSPRESNIMATVELTHEAAGEPAE